MTSVLYFVGINMNANLTIREYQTEDWPTIKLVLLESDIYSAYGPTILKSEKNRIEFYSQVPEKGRVFIAVVPDSKLAEQEEKNENGEEDSTKDLIAGYAVIDFFGHGIFILSLIIGKQYRDQGYGKQLMEYIKKFALKDVQYTILRGFADERLVNVHAFLLKQGFKACGFVEHDLEWNHSTIHYVYRLQKEKEEESDTLISA
jgi:ribosomal protein S18 acetylase RimI-like enzyme